MKRPPLFDELEPPPPAVPVVSCADRGAHNWRPTTTVWEGETFARLTRTCLDCGEVRGRA